MKNIKLVLLSVVLSTILLFSCKKDTTAQQYSTKIDTVHVTFTPTVTPQIVSGKLQVTCNIVMTPALQDVRVEGNFSYQVYDGSTYITTITHYYTYAQMPFTDNLPYSPSNPIIQQILYAVTTYSPIGNQSYYLIY